MGAACSWPGWECIARRRVGARDARSLRCRNPITDPYGANPVPLAGNASCAVRQLDRPRDTIRRFGNDPSYRCPLWRTEIPGSSPCGAALWCGSALRYWSSLPSVVGLPSDSPCTRSPRTRTRSTPHMAPRRPRLTPPRPPPPSPPPRPPGRCPPCCPAGPPRPLMFVQPI
jgi:hypothetical protein